MSRLETSTIHSRVAFYSKIKAGRNRDVIVSSGVLKELFLPTPCQTKVCFLEFSKYLSVFSKQVSIILNINVIYYLGTFLIYVSHVHTF